MNHRFESQDGSYWGIWMRSVDGMCSDDIAGMMASTAQSRRMLREGDCISFARNEMELSRIDGCREESAFMIFRSVLGRVCEGILGGEVYDRSLLESSRIIFGGGRLLFRSMASGLEMLILRCSGALRFDPDQAIDDAIEAFIESYRQCIGSDKMSIASDLARSMGRIALQKGSERASMPFPGVMERITVLGIFGAILKSSLDNGCVPGSDEIVATIDRLPRCWSDGTASCLNGISRDLGGSYRVSVIDAVNGYLEVPALTPFRRDRRRPARHRRAHLS